MVLIAALPAYLIRFQILGVPFTLLEAMILISFGTWFFKNYKQVLQNIKRKLKIDGRRQTADDRKLINYPFGKEIIFLLIISYIAVAVSGFSYESLGIWKAYFFEPILLFILIINVFGKREKREKLSFGYPKLSFILWPLAVSALIVSLFAIYQKFTGAFIFNEFWAAKETRRITSFFGYPNAVGLYLGPIILILFGWLFSQARTDKKGIFNFQFSIFKSPLWRDPARNKKNKVAGQFSITNYQIILIKKFFTILTIIASVMSIYFAKSEGALIGVAAGLALFGLLAGKKTRRATTGLIILALAGIMAYAPAKDYAIKKITLKDLSGEIRKAQWRETLEMLKDGRLITGAGLANYQKAVKPYHKEGIFFNKDNDPVSAAKSFCLTSGTKANTGSRLKFICTRTIYF